VLLAASHISTDADEDLAQEVLRLHEKRAPGAAEDGAWSGHSRGETSGVSRHDTARVRPKMALLGKRGAPTDLDMISDANANSPPAYPSEKPASPKFSIRHFVSALRLGAQARPTWNPLAHRDRQGAAAAKSLEL
jgi:hypothetical protein